VRVHMQSNFDIAQTKTLEAVTTTDEQARSADLQKRVADALGEAEKDRQVIEAAEASAAAADRLAKLRAAQRTLNEYARAMRDRFAKSSAAVVDAVIESAAAGKPEFGKLSEVVAIETRNRYASRALEQIAETLIPAAQIASLRAESHAMEARARAVRGIAQERAERVLEQMRGAVTEEIALPVDLSKGVAGALLEHAEGLKRRAVQISEQADEMERGRI